MTTKTIAYRTRAPFATKGRWSWVTWTHTEANSHAAIRRKADELGADTWDYGQADHFELSRCPF